MTNVSCLRCGQEGPAIAEANPYPGALGETIAKSVCQTCWEAWKRFSVNVINDLRLRPFLPRDRAILEQQMKQFLNLEVQPIGIQVPSDRPTAAGPLSKERVIEILQQIYDPEIPVNIYDLGLIYDIGLQGEAVTVTMTLTTPHCPAAQSLPSMVKEALGRMPGVKDVTIDVVWDPPWSRERISEEGRRILGI